ncbi:unnamed protein product [Brachionus calyciflorus]|uniref:Transmembrane protein 107 n=1 Tax=Brachionus calyciflorus TaxID=104777 RepID=A0A813S786_9BILA|nr:unnamed protein product [Brachionus calyciflorus]
MLFKLPLSVPIRFLTSILHIIITSIILMYRTWNVNACSTLKTPEEFKLKDDQLIIALSFILALTSFEILSLIFGLSLYSNIQNFLSTSFHLSGFVASLFFLFYRACSDLIWIIFSVCCFIPFLTEIITIFRICLCKRLPACYSLIFQIAFGIKSDSISKIKCSRTSVCGVGLCCRGNDDKIIPAALNYFTQVDWWRSQLGINPGTCTSDLAREGEFCDSFCTCAKGLLCTPNLLCRSCGNICMTSEFVNKLVNYYDQGCNCIGNVGTISANPESGIPLTKPHQVNLNRHPVYDADSLKRLASFSSKNSKIKIVDNIVQLPFRN